MDSSYSESVGKRVRALRDERGWTQAELAGRLHWKRERVTQLEDGHVVSAKLDTLATVAEALNTPEYPMTLPELLWPVLEPWDAEQLASQMRDRFDRRIRELGDQLYGEYLAKLTREEGARFILNLALVLHHEKRETVQFVLELVQTAAIRAAGWDGVEAWFASHE